MIIILILLGLLSLYIIIFQKVDAKLYPQVVSIDQGESFDSISQKLYTQNVVRNEFIFKSVAKLFAQDSRIQRGEYTFKKPLNMIELIDKLANGRFEYTPVVVTIYEGEDSRFLATQLYTAFKNVAASTTPEALQSILQAKEGYLFPETYNYPPSATLEDIFKKINTEFVQRIAKYNIPANDLTRILTIASILEKEVPHPEDMKVVAGIINNRLAQGMPLQMDSTLGYFTGKASLELTTQDLQSTSPYNTYKVKGLPPAPIGNPGDIAIEAALNPDKNDYLYFLSDKEGVNHYTKTYAEHLKNRKLYLGK